MGIGREREDTLGLWRKFLLHKLAGVEANQFPRMESVPSKPDVPRGVLRHTSYDALGQIGRHVDPAQSALFREIQLVVDGNPHPSIAVLHHRGDQRAVKALLGADGRYLPAAKNVDGKVVPDPDRAVARCSYNTRFRDRQALLHGKGGHWQVAEPIKAFGGDDPKIPLSIFKEVVYGVAGKTVRGSEVAHVAVLNSVHSVVHGADPHIPSGIRKESCDL